MAREKSLAKTQERGLQQVEPWDTFSNMERMMRNFFMSPFPTFRNLDRWIEGMGGRFTPEVDLSETENEVILSATIPGMDKDDINIDVTPDSITVSGERRTDEDKSGTRYHVRQQSYGSFNVSYALPTEIKPDDVKAAYKNGILEVTMPKAETAKPHRVAVAVEE